MSARLVLRAVSFGVLMWARTLPADNVRVRFAEGRIHGFVVLRDLEDQILASGNLTQLASGNRVTSELTFHFKDVSTGCRQARRLLATKQAPATSAR